MHRPDRGPAGSSGAQDENSFAAKGDSGFFQGFGDSPGIGIEPAETAGPGQDGVDGAGRNRRVVQPVQQWKQRFLKRGGGVHPLESCFPHERQNVFRPVGPDPEISGVDAKAGVKRPVNFRAQAVKDGTPGHAEELHDVLP